MPKTSIPGTPSTFAPLAGTVGFLFTPVLEGAGDIPVCEMSIRMLPGMDENSGMIKLVAELPSIC